MEKKSKKNLIIGLTSLFLVMLILLGLTYAYYRTRVIGNDNKTSISVESKKMEITYHDGSAVLSTEGLIEPGFTATKEFSVENTGSETSTFSIMLDNVVSAPKTIPAEEASAEDESVLASTEDDYGTSYYFRGNVQNNYVNFAGMCWRIVRVQGNGSTKLILEDASYECDNASFTGNWSIGTGNFGYSDTPYDQGVMNYLNLDNKAINYDSSMATSFQNFQVTKLYEYLDYLNFGEWCFADNAYSSDVRDITTATPLSESEKNILRESYSDFYFDSYIRLSNKNPKPTLNCSGTKLTKYKDGTNMYVATLTADEIVYAGGKVEDYSDFYLLNDFQRASWLDGHWYSLSPSTAEGGFETVFKVDHYGVLGYQGFVYGSENNFRPSVVLRSDVSLGLTNYTQDGTIDKPYVIG